jgi:hypothetical protein
MKLICCYCSNEFIVLPNNIGQRNNSIRLGLPIYCNRTCAGLGRRGDETLEEKRQIKTWYDLFLRISMTEDEKIFESFSRCVYFLIDYKQNPNKYKKWRNKRMPKHVEYCRQPEYKEYKKGYDEQYRAKKHFGSYWESAIILKNLDNEIDYRESKRHNKIYNKSTTKRKRAWQKQLKHSHKNLLQLI